MIRASTLLTLLIVLAAIGSLAGSATAQEMPASAAGIPANLAPPEDAVLLFELGARGVQIYACEADPDDATAFVWTLTGPEADLLNARGEVVGRHVAGPTWQGHDGSSVAGAVLERADASDADAIPWLLLEANAHEGSGAFSSITHIQRLDTAGGAAPGEGCDEAHAGEEVLVPYEATYAFFYPAATADSGTPTPAMAIGAVTIRVFTCPGELSQPASQEEIDQDALMAACAPLPASEFAPTLSSFAGGEPMAGTETEPGVYTWHGLALGAYAIGGSGGQPANLVSLRVTDASGAPLQNPVLRLEGTSPHVEYRYFFFVAGGTPAATPTS